MSLDGSSIRRFLGIYPQTPDSVDSVLDNTMPTPDSVVNELDHNTDPVGVTNVAVNETSPAFYPPTPNSIHNTNPVVNDKDVVDERSLAFFPPTPHSVDNKIPVGDYDSMVQKQSLAFYPPTPVSTTIEMPNKKAFYPPTPVSFDNQVVDDTVPCPFPTVITIEKPAKKMALFLDTKKKERKLQDGMEKPISNDVSYPLTGNKIESIQYGSLQPTSIIFDNLVVDYTVPCYFPTAITIEKPSKKKALKASDKQKLACPIVSSSGASMKTVIINSHDNNDEKKQIMNKAALTYFAESKKVELVDTPLLPNDDKDGGVSAAPHHAMVPIETVTTMSTVLLSGTKPTDDFVENLILRNQQIVAEASITKHTASLHDTKDYRNDSNNKANTEQIDATSRDKRRFHSNVTVNDNVRQVYSIIRKQNQSLGNGSFGPIYGELTMFSMQRVVNCMKQYAQFNQSSWFIDVGSGMGKPNLHVSQDPGVIVSYGIECVETRWMQGMTSLYAIVQKIQEAKLVAERKQCLNHTDVAANNNKISTTTGDNKLRIRCNCLFQKGDINNAITFNPFTHVYMFSIGYVHLQP
jgi:Histone methylation protein DOT1